MIEAAEDYENKGRRIRQLPKAEYHEKIRKGLCFTCDERNSHWNMCKNKHYGAMLLEETMETQVDVCSCLDLQSMAGLTPKRVLKLWGTLGNQQVTVLIDSGATH